MVETQDAALALEPLPLEDEHLSRPFAGSAKVGLIRTYLKPEDLEPKFQTISKLSWNW